jgi:Mg-chelatase subunit ChlD
VEHIAVIDCEQQRIRLGRCRQLAERWQADYLTLNDLIFDHSRNKEPDP